MVSCEKHDYGSMKESCCPICLSEQTNLATNAIISAGKPSSPVEPEVIQKPKPKTLQAIFEIVDNIDFELSQLEDIAKGEIGEKITLLRKYIDENRVSV